MISRRSILAGLITAPAIVKFDSLMKVKQFYSWWPPQCTPAGSILSAWEIDTNFCLMYNTIREQLNIPPLVFVKVSPDEWDLVVNSNPVYEMSIVERAKVPVEFRCH